MTPSKRPERYYVELWVRGERTEHETWATSDALAKSHILYRVAKERGIHVGLLHSWLRNGTADIKVTRS